MTPIPYAIELGTDSRTDLDQLQRRANWLREGHPLAQKIREQIASQNPDEQCTVQVGDLLELATALDQCQQHLRLSCWDGAEDHAFAQKIARRYFPETEVEGDSYGVPSVCDLIEKLAGLIPPQ